MNYNKVIHLLVGVTILLALPLIYLGLLPRGQVMLSPWQWLLSGGFALPLMFNPRGIGAPEIVNFNEEAR